MDDKRQTRKDLPEREFDSDLNSPALSNYDEEPVDQRDSGARREPEKKRGEDDDSEHGIGGADNLSR